MIDDNIFKIILFSDLHCGDSRFDENLMATAIEDINDIDPDLFIVAGDLTVKGYKEQFEEAKKYIDQINCDQQIIIAGNHDHRNVGWVFFEEIFGKRFHSREFDFNVKPGETDQEKIKVVAVDSNKPDLNDGEVGRQHYDWIRDEFKNSADFKVFVLHHHLVSVPATGRERNIVWDAGDVLEVLRESDVDLTLCGHRHVPYVWTINQSILVHSGTVSTFRTRGYSRPAFMSIDVSKDDIIIATHEPGKGAIKTEGYSRRTALPLD